MPHDCIDWTTRPPTRKLPLLILSRGDDRVYTSVPKEFKQLEDIARKEFDLGDGDIEMSSSCLNLCDGIPARITEGAWEHMSSYIGCATVDVVGPRDMEGPPQEEEPPRPENVANERDAGLPLNADNGDELAGRPDTPANEPARDEEDAMSDHGGDHEYASAPEHHHEEPADEQVSAAPRKPRHRRHVVSEDEGDQSEREPAKSQIPADASPGKQIQKERESHYRPKPDPPSEQPDRPIKRERQDTGSGGAESQSDTLLQPQTQSSDNQKLMIRVAHRPSKQESKFTTKSTTRVQKVLSGACKSFGLDTSRATLYLIVSTEDEEGETENLFPCDKNDSIARAGAERDTESRFVLKIAGEA